MKRDTSGKTVTLRMQNHEIFVANGKLHGENVQFKGKCNFFDVLELSGWFIIGRGGEREEGFALFSLTSFDQFLELSGEFQLNAEAGYYTTRNTKLTLRRKYRQGFFTDR